MKPSDEDLAGRARDGDVDAFEALVRRFQVPLLHFLRRHTSVTDAEDLVQDAFVRAYTRLDRYAPDRSFRTWLFTIAYRLCLNHRRRARLTLPLESAGHPVAADVGGLERLEQDETRLQLWDRVGRHVSDRQFTVLWLHCVEGLPLKDVARVIGSTQVAVRALMSRSRRKLARCLAEPDGTTASLRAGPVLAVQESPT